MFSIIENPFLKIGLERDDLYVTTTLTVIGLNLIALTLGSVALILFIVLAFMM